MKIVPVASLNTNQTGRCSRKSSDRVQIGDTAAGGEINFKHIHIGVVLPAGVEDASRVGRAIVVESVRHPGERFKAGGADGG